MQRERGKLLSAHKMMGENQVFSTASYVVIDIHSFVLGVAVWFCVLVFFAAAAQHC